ncbi:TlpA family protein disulfide reductase [Patescibacteria group bacterium]|nr:TlpA family protein disulfide reductase [Patescibacteria group bacterium]
MVSLKRFFILVIFALVLAGCTHAVRQGDSGGAEQAAVAQVDGRFVKGESAPKVVATSFEGDEVDVSQFYGERAVILDFWAGWCPFCIEEMPLLQKAQDQYGDDLVMIGVHRTDTESVAVGERFSRERGVSYLLIQDGDGSLYRAAGGIGMPVAVFIDKQGVVQEIKSGPKTTEEIEEKTARLIK